MAMRLATFLVCAVLTAFACPGAYALDFFFVPDTSAGNIGETVLLSGQIGDSPLMRGFTVYMAYDTNVIDVSEPPVAGSLISGHSGLQFNYFDHAPFEPNLLEIGGTIFGTDFWQGPGELFQVRFALRQCAVEDVVAPYAPYFLAADGDHPTVTYHAATVIVCPGLPMSPSGLTVYPNSPSSVQLLWPAVALNFAGQPLPSAPVYRIYRQQILPSVLPVEIIATVADTVYIDDLTTGTDYIYQVTAQTTP
jgi:hypothetical protein